MKRSLLSTAILGISLLLPSQANAAAFSAIYSFGDSLTDTGNVFTATGGFPPSSPVGEYFPGRFSNGPVWIEYLKDRLGVSLVNSAYGGATTGEVNTLNNFLGISGLRGLQQEIGLFAFDNPVADPNGLYVVWAGANDYLPNSGGFTPESDPTEPLNNIKNAVDTLVGIGAKNIMVANLPDLGKIPFTNGLNADGVCPPTPTVNKSEDADCLNELTAAHNAGLLNLFSSLPSDVKLFQLDINSLFDQILANPAQFGFANVTDACYIYPNPSCSNSNDYFFWDSQHPTTEGHRLIAALAVNTLGIPEPSAIVGLTTLGILGIWTGKRQKKINK